MGLNDLAGARIALRGVVARRFSLARKSRVGPHGPRRGGPINARWRWPRRARVLAADSAARHQANHRDDGE